MDAKDSTMQTGRNECTCTMLCFMVKFRLVFFGLGCVLCVVLRPSIYDVRTGERGKTRVDAYGRGQLHVDVHTANQK